MCLKELSTGGVESEVILYKPRYEILMRSKSKKTIGIIMLK